MKIHLSGLIGRFRTLQDNTYRIEIEGQDIATVSDEVISKLAKTRGEYVNVTIEFDDKQFATMEEVKKSFKK
jgi:hypothetical protein